MCLLVENGPCTDCFPCWKLLVKQPHSCWRSSPRAIHVIHFPDFEQCSHPGFQIYIYILLVASTPLKNISQIGSSSKLLWKIKNVLFCAGRYAAALECADAAERVRRIKCRGHVPTVCQNLWPATPIVVEGKTQPVEKCHHVFGNQGPHDDSKPIEKTDEWCK